MAKSAKSIKPEQKRAYLKQSDVPGASLEDALRVPRTILDHHAGQAVPPLYVAKVLDVDPRGSHFRVLSGAAIAFGLIEGGAQAASISLTDLARRVLRPKVEGGEISAMREAVLRPRIFGEFLQRYDGHAFPRRDIACNVVEDMGVPRDKTTEVVERLESSARAVGFLEEVKGKLYVSLHGVACPPANEELVNEAGDESTDDLPGHMDMVPEAVRRLSAIGSAFADDERRKRVFVTHGKSRDLVEPIKKLLEYGELTPVISIERQSVSKPVPDKVMDDMRSCGAAIIHVDADQTITDKDGREHTLLNPNVLIEIGAAMAIYGRRFILLVRDGVKLPSNLQGLYEVRYSNDSLDAAATIKLLEAIKDIKNHTLPSEGSLGATDGHQT
jgi:predicted nucleotide-binding protein